MKKRLLGRLVACALVLATAFTTVVITSETAEAKTFTYGQVTGAQAGYIKTIFNAKQYAIMYPDLKDAGVVTDEDLWAHFINCGIWEFRQPSATFNIDAYASQNPDLQEAFGDDMLSYYVYYADNWKKDLWRSEPTLAHAGRVGNTVYSVKDFVKGQKGPKAGAIPVQTPSMWAAYNKSVQEKTEREEKL